MKNVVVYAFELYDPVQDAFVVAKGMATLETITEEGGRPIPSISRTVLDTEINDRGRYHEPTKT
jgi:hypothetical protein